MPRRERENDQNIDARNVNAQDQNAEGELNRAAEHQNAAEPQNREAQVNGIVEELAAESKRLRDYS